MNRWPRRANSASIRSYHPSVPLNPAVLLPDYRNSIVNLMSSILAGLGREPSLYPPLAAPPPASLSQARNVVLLVIDGLGFDYLTGPGRGSLLHQHLQGRITSVFPSTTVSAITVFLTGLAPQQHGLTGWFMYFREIGAVTVVLQFRQRLSPHSLRDCGVQPAQLFDHSSVFDQLNVVPYVVAPQRIIDSDFNQVFSGLARRRAYSSSKQFFTVIADTLRESDERKYLYAYYPEIDALSHLHGVHSRQVEAQFSALDKAFGEFLKAIAGTDTALIVSADHGFIDSEPDRVIELDQHPELAETLILPLCGERRAAYCYVHPEKTQRFERYVLSELAEYALLYKSEQLVEQGYFGLGVPHPRLQERIGHYTLIMKENYTLKDWLLGERRHTQVGVHGGLSEAEMEVPLIFLRI
jgi:predicted AlkP superfamily pyrophosphatase or phosphodiesterase